MITGPRRPAQVPARPSGSQQLTAYVHGIDGPVVVVPARIAAWLQRHAELDRLRLEVRGVDTEVDGVLVALRVAALAWRTSAVGTGQRNQPELDAPCAEMGSSAAADELGLTDRAIRRAIKDGRLAAMKVDGRWRITREDFEHYRAARRAA